MTNPILRARSFALGRFLLPLCLLAAGSLFASCSSEQGADSGRQYTIDELLGTVSLRGASFSHNLSHILVSSDASGIFNVYAVPIGGGEPVALTHSTDDAILILAGFPNDPRFLYTKDRGGDELHHVYVHEPDGSVTDLTPGEGHKANFLGWSAEGESFFLTTNERDQRYFDLYEVDPSSYERRLLYTDEDGFELKAVSPDRRYVAFEKIATRNDTDAFVYDRERGLMLHLSPHEGDVVNEVACFSPDGASAYILTDAGAEFRYLSRHDLETGEVATVLAPDWDVLGAEFSEDGEYLVARVNHDARTRLVVLKADGMTPVEISAIPEADISTVRVSPNEKAMVFYASSGRSPRDLFYYVFGEEAPRQLTTSLNPAVDASDLVEPEIVRFASFDGLTIPGLLYKPRSASPDNKVPALVWVHGGPGGQSRIGYLPLMQYLVNHGYAVYSINNRGSSGYGKTFFAADDRRHGGADLDDCVASKQMLIDTGWVDGDRIGIIGGSYGGFMVLAALTFQPTEFEVGVDLFGISNWVRTLEQMPVWWEAMREALYRELGNPETDREYLLSISPLFHADKIERPLMVLQGANDPRVHKVESDEIVAAAEANGVPVEYVVFDDEGHGFRKKENQRVGYEAILRFLDEHLARKGSTL